MSAAGRWPAPKDLADRPAKLVPSANPRAPDPPPVCAACFAGDADTVTRVSHRHRVVVVGAGFGGLAAAKALVDAPVDVVLVDANNFHTFQPLLYQVATAGLDADDVAFPARGIFHRQHNVDFKMRRVTGVDLDQRVVHLAGDEQLGYDHLVLAAGAVTAHYGVPGADEYAFGLKTLSDAVALRSHVLRCFEDAADDPALVEEGHLTVVISGGGPTGVELAGGLIELFTKVLRKDFPNLDIRRARVVLVEMADRLLGTFAPRLSSRAYRTLTRRGVEVVLGTGVSKVEPDAVHLSDGTRIPTRTLVWTAGVEATPLTRSMGVATGAGGRIVVNPDLTVPGHPEVFAVGDVAVLVDGQGGSSLPGVAQAAIQGGRHAGRMIRAQLDGEPTTSLRYHDKGSMATIGRHDAVAELPGGILLTGPLGWLAWLGLHLLYLIGFRNRANVLVNWAWNYITYDRGSRIIGEGVDELT
jgi:NADH dehydrogenase